MWIKFSEDRHCYRARIVKEFKKRSLLELIFLPKEEVHYMEIEELDFENDRYYPLLKPSMQYANNLEVLNKEKSQKVYESAFILDAKRRIKEYHEEEFEKLKKQMNITSRITVIK